MNADIVQKMVRRWTPAVTAVTVLTAVAGFAVGRAQTTMYQADGLVLVVQSPRTDAAAYSLTIDEVTATYAKLMTQPAVLRQVISDLHLKESPDTLAKQISVAPESTSELVGVHVVDSSPKQATAIANTLMSDFVSKITSVNQAQITQAGGSLNSNIQSLESTLASEQTALAKVKTSNGDATTLQGEIDGNESLLTQLTSQYSTFRAQEAQQLDAVSVASQAEVPTQPSSPKPGLDGILGGILGLALGLLFATARQYLDQRIRNEDDVALRLGLPTLAVIPRYGKARGLLRRSPADAQLLQTAEAYRQLRTNLLFSAVETPLRSIVVTSSRPGEGKSMTVANLAGVLAAAGEDVLVVDGDMRRPRQHVIFSKPMLNGLSDMLIRRPDRNGSAPVSGENTEFENLRLLSCGTLPPNPSELMSSKHTAGVLHELETAHDLVIIDTPPIGVVSDAGTIASKVTATIMVIEIGRNNARQARAMVDALRGTGATVIGVVLNKAPRSSRKGYKKDYYEQYRQQPDVQEALKAEGLTSPHHVWLPIASVETTVSPKAGHGDRVHAKR